MTRADEERLDASRWFWYSDLLERAALDDVERGRRWLATAKSRTDREQSDSR